MTTRSPSPERLDDILVEDSYADYEQQPSPRGPEETGDGEASSAFHAAPQPDAGITSQASGSAGLPKPVRQRIPVGPMEDFKSAPKRQPVPQTGQASAANAWSQAQAEPSQPPASQQQQQPQQQQSSGATRYFLLKSVSIDNIEKSVAEGVWATQVCLTAC